MVQDGAILVGAMRLAAKWNILFITFSIGLPQH